VFFDGVGRLDRVESLTYWVTHYGYGGLFVLLVLGVFGIPVPDEIILVFSGYLVYKGDFSLLTAIAVAFVGTGCGISVSYTLGRTVGLYLVTKYGQFVHITQERLAKARWWFERVGRWGLLFGYFVPGFRHIMAYLAGTSRLAFREFALFAYTGGLLWSVVFILSGLFLGERWREAARVLHRHLVIGSLVVIGGLAAYYLSRNFLRRR